MKPDPMANTCDRNTRDKQGIPDPDPLDAINPPPVDRYCDVVLTGGVTDGVIYPWAILELARVYRFKNIGGTSVGAMAAALTAAAEYSRRYGSVAGFNEVLLKLPRELGKDIDGNARLFSLFQPAKSTQRLFELFVGLFRTDGATDKKGALRKFLLPTRRTGKESRICRFVLAVKILVRRFVLAVLRTRKNCKVCKNLLEIVLARWTYGICRFVLAVLSAYRYPASIGILVGVLIGIAIWWRGDFGFELGLILEVLFSTVNCVLVFVPLLVGIVLYRDIAHGLVPNGFGLCTGCRKDTTSTGQQTLVEWLHVGIQGAAGKPLDQPLTFKDLWDAPGGPVGRPMPLVRQTRKSRSIDLRMVTTNLTHGRPYGLPLDDQTSRLFFTIEDLAPYFPEPVLRHLEKHSRCYESSALQSDPGKEYAPKGFRELPEGELPIIVAARLSLSFPVLFSAVPLWAIDYEPRLTKDRRLRKCWFSDGGICSNFPIHLFDSAIPGWPTFGISLASRSLFWSKEAVWLTRFHNEGRGDSWDRFGDETLPLTGEMVSPLSRLFGFIHSIIFTAKDWNDKTSMRMPGVRDRVVHVALKQGEGGLNLELTDKQILKLAHDYGKPAGRALVEKFIDPAPGNLPSTAWNEHRWVRFNTLLVALRERIEAIGAAAELAPYAIPLTAQIAEAQRKPPLREENTKGVTLTAMQANDLQRLFAALKDLEAGLAQAATPQAYKPLPTPSMHIRPPL